MTKDKIQGLRNELLFNLNAVGSYETHKELWDAFYKYEEALSIANVSKRTFTEDDVYNNIAEFVMLYATYDYPSMTKEETIKDIKELWDKLI